MAAKTAFITGTAGRFFVASHFFLSRLPLWSVPVISLAEVFRTSLGSTMQCIIVLWARVISLLAFFSYFVVFVTVDLAAQINTLFFSEISAKKLISEIRIIFEKYKTVQAEPNKKSLENHRILKSIAGLPCFWRFFDFSFCLSFVCTLRTVQYRKTEREPRC